MSIQVFASLLNSAKIAWLEPTVGCKSPVATDALSKQIINLSAICIPGDFKAAFSPDQAPIPQRRILHILLLRALIL